MSYKTIPIGEKAPEVVNVVIEIPRDSHNKYEYDEKLDEIKLDRVLHSPVYYPTEYGFIPQTRSGDGDSLDILVFISTATFPGCVLEARPIGMLNMEDDAGKDWKILAVAHKDPHFQKVTTIEELNQHLLKEIHHFFEVYKHLEGKWTKVHEWQGKEAAYKRITEAMQNFSKE